LESVSKWFGKEDAGLTPEQKKERQEAADKSRDYALTLYKIMKAIGWRLDHSDSDLNDLLESWEEAVKELQTQENQKISGN
jgi:hypothetical protein